LEFISRWKDHLHQSTGRCPHEYIQEFLDRSDPIPAVERWTPGLVEEVEGIAEGADVDFASVLALQLADQEWLYRRARGVVRPGLGSGECSALAVFAEEDTPTLLGQNLDLPSFWDGFQILMRIGDPGTDIESLVVSIAGLIALNGVNNQSLGICVNVLDQLPHAADGLPLAFVIRGVLAQRTLDGAMDFLYSIRHATGQNYVIGDQTRAVSLECSAKKVCQFTPHLAAKRLFHTNHPLANDDQVTYESWRRRLPTHEREREHRNRLDSENRLSLIKERLGADSTRLTLDAVKSILSSHESLEFPVCRHAKRGEELATVISSIMVLGEAPELHVAFGPACSTEFDQLVL
jgi:hypothetical protein